MEIYKGRDGWRGRIRRGDDIIFQSSDSYESEAMARKALGLDEGLRKLAYDIRDYMKKHHPSEFVSGAVRDLIENLIQAADRI